MMTVSSTHSLLTLPFNPPPISPNWPTTASALSKCWSSLTIPQKSLPFAVACPLAYLF